MGNTRADRNRSTWLGRVALLVCSVLAFAAAGTGVAQAAVNFNGVCESGELCLFKDFNSSTNRPSGLVIDYGWAGGRTCDSTYTNNNFPNTNQPVNDQLSGWYNGTGVTVRIYDDSNYGGDHSDLAPGSIGNLRNTQVGTDDASSHRSIGSGC